MDQVGQNINLGLVEYTGPYIFLCRVNTIVDFEFRYFCNHVWHIKTNSGGLGTNSTLIYLIVEGNKDQTHIYKQSCVRDLASVPGWKYLDIALWLEAVWACTRFEDLWSMMAWWRMMLCLPLASWGAGQGDDTSTVTPESAWFHAASHMGELNSFWAST